MTEEKALPVTPEDVTKTVGSVVDLGRKVAAQWIGVSRNALDAAAETLRSTSDTLADLTKRIDKRA